MLIGVPLLVALVGLVIYVAASSPKLAELGRAGFWCGLFVGLLRFGGAAVSLLR
jgi:hypothetical protein